MPQAIPTYGVGEGVHDIRQTRYRLDADVRALRKKLAPKRLVPFAAVGAGLAALTVLIRRIRRARR